MATRWILRARLAPSWGRAGLAARLGAFLFTITANPYASHAQWLTQGPVFGAVTDSSAKVYLRAPGANRLTLHLLADTPHAQPAQLVVADFHPVDHSAVVPLRGLMPDTRYTLAVDVDGRRDTTTGSLRTFPRPGTRGVFTLATGSCQETPNMKVFDRLAELQPRILIHTGDYTYPDYQMRPDYAAWDSLVAISYHRRYDEHRMKPMLRHVPIDYVYDDNDYVGGGGGTYHKNGMDVSWAGFRKPTYTFRIDSFPQPWRRNVIEGYADYFPHYPLPDTATGIHHAFTMANAEFLFLDRCSSRDYGMDHAFVYHPRNNRWKFDPPVGTGQFGRAQLHWLKRRLKASTADWIFLVVGAPLNAALHDVIVTGTKIQKLRAKGYNGFHMAVGLSFYGPGYPSELYELIDFIEAEGIRNVIVLSGDTHHNVVDDGRNAMLPELNASGLSVDGTHLAYYLKLIGRAFMQFNYHGGVWNGGGNGLGNRNFKNAYGRVTIVRNDYVDLDVVDEDGQRIGHSRIFHSSHPQYRDLSPWRRRWQRRRFTPTRQSITVTDHGHISNPTAP